MVNKNYQTLDLKILHHWTDPGVESLLAASSKVEDPELCCIPECYLPRTEDHSPTSHLENPESVSESLESICEGDHLSMRDDHQVAVDIIAKASSIDRSW